MLSFTIFQTQLKAEEELGSQHTVGLGFILDYEYSEPYLMHLRAGQSATADEYANIGILYNYKNAFLTNGYLSELELDTSFQSMTQTYWSNGTGTMQDIDVEIFNLRALYGIQVSNKLMLKSGLGYRHLYHYWQNRQSTTGGYGYDREQDYTYIPILAELNSSKGILKFEYDYIVEGSNTSYAAYLGGANKDNTYTNNNGHMWKISHESQHGDYIFEPYYEFLRVETSDAVGGYVEPYNVTNEIGFRIKKEFNSKRASVPDYKKMITDDQFYFGFQLLMSEIDSGWSSPAGNTKINEENDGFSIVSGMNVIDGVKGVPFRLDFEVAFNQFGDATLTGNANDSFITDGRYGKKTYTNGTRLTWSNNDSALVIESYSTSLGVKPSFNILDTLSIYTNLGLHRWDQSEITSYSGSVSNSEYKGTDIYYGVGAGYKFSGFSAEIEYLEHEMYYNAKSFSGALKYNF
jgi:hypothetical protein